METETVDCFNRTINYGDIVVIGKHRIEVAFFIKNQRSFQFIPFSQWMATRISEENKYYISYIKYYPHLILRIDREYFEKNLLLEEDKEYYKIIRDYVDGNKLG